MTQVTFDLRETSAAGATPVGAIQYAPYRRHIDVTTVVLPVAAATVLVNGQVTIELEPTDATWCWQIIERVTGGIIRYVAVPDSPAPIAYTDLVDVDPTTLAPLNVAASSALVLAVSDASASATAAAASAATAATAPFDASRLTTGTVDDARLPVTAQAATLAGRFAPFSRPPVRHRSHLARWESALRDKAAPVITVVGNSIALGVGSDGSTSTTTGYYAPYREYAWPAQLRKMLAARGGYLPAENFVHPGSWFAVAQNLVGGASRTWSNSAFGPLSGGGLVLNSSTAAADFIAADMGRFTEVDVFYWGTASGVAGYSPAVLIDDVVKDSGGVVSTGNLVRTTITGLADAQHKITVQGTGSANGCNVPGVVTRRSSTGIVVNRVAFAGATVLDVTADTTTTFTAQQKARNLDAAIMAGYSDLVVLAMTANEVYGQVPLATFQSEVQAIIDRAVGAGACVLLTGDPAVNNEETAYAIPGSAYRAALSSLSDSNTNVAFADINAIFGNRADAVTQGMWDGGGSVHPMHEGHRRIADFLLRDVLPGASVL